MPENTRIEDVEQLEDRLSEPPRPRSSVRRLEGDLIVLGVGGKMGPTLARMARRACDAGPASRRRVIGVARFSDPGLEDWLRDRGIETIRCDLLDPAQLATPARRAQRRLHGRHEVRRHRPGGR